MKIMYILAASGRHEPNGYPNQNIDYFKQLPGIDAQEGTPLQFSLCLGFYRCNGPLLSE
jgi:hypothetical protein